MFTGLNIVYFICAVVIPVTSIITGYIMMKRPPKEINNVVGYRTRRSKSSKEAWDFANVFCGRNTLIFGIVSLIAAIVLYLVLANEDNGLKLSLLIMAIQCVLMVIVMAVPTELALKKKFGI